MDNNMRYDKMEKFIDDYAMFETACLARGIEDHRATIALYHVFAIEELAKTMRSDLDE